MSTSTIPAWIAPDVRVWYECDGTKHAATVMCWPYQHADSPVALNKGAGTLQYLIIGQVLPRRISHPLVKLREDNGRTIVMGLYPFDHAKYDPDCGEVVKYTACGLDHLTPRRDGCCYCGTTTASMAPRGPGGELVCGSCAQETP
jgi:hypothetical protein